MSRGRPYRCPEPSCRKKSLTRPRMMLHVWGHALGAETGLEFSVVENFLLHHYAAGRVKVDAKTGDIVPVGSSWSELGETGAAIGRVVGEVNEEQRQAREERRQARRESLDLEEEEAS